MNNAAKDATTGKEIQLNKHNLGYTTGIIIERVGSIDEVAGVKSTKSEADYRAEYGTTIDDIEKGLGSKVGSQILNLKTRLTNVINGTSTTGYMNLSFDVSELDNKNRVRYYNNLAARLSDGSEDTYNLVDNDNKDKIFRAYAYLKKSSEDIQISETPVYFTIYDIAQIQNGTRGGV